MQATTVPAHAPRSARRWFGLPSAIRRAWTALRASERHARTVWLIIVTPPAQDGRVITIITTKSWRQADSLYQGVVAGIVEDGGGAAVKLTPYRTALYGEELLAELLAFDDDLDGLPAAREFRP